MLTGSSPSLPGVDRDELLDEQRVALGALRRSGRRARRRRGAGRARARAPRRARRARARCGWAAARPTRGASRAARGASRQTSRIGAPLDSATTWSSRSSSARLGPVDVLDRDDERAVAGEPLEQPPQRPRRLLDLRRLVGQARGAEDAADRLLVAREQLLAHVPADRRRARARCRRARGTSCPRHRRGSAPRAPSPRRRRASGTRRASRDLPIPGGPASVTTRQARSSRTRANAARNSSISRARPTNGVSETRSSAGCSSGQLEQRPAALVDRDVGRDAAAQLFAEQDLALRRRAPPAGRRLVIAAPVANVAPCGPVPRNSSPASMPSRSAASGVAQLDGRRVARSASSPCDSVSPKKPTRLSPR